MQRGMSVVLAILVAAVFGNGQAYLLHAHDEDPWHAHAMDAAGGLGPMRSDSHPHDGHEHDESFPLDPSDEGIVVVLKSAPAIPSYGPGAGPWSPEPLCANVSPAIATATSSMTADMQPRERCAHPATASRAVESLLRSNHALLI